jgi:putative transposase
MSKKQHTAQQIITKLRQIEAAQNKGVAVAEACGKHGIKVQTFYRWRKEYSGLRSDQTKRLNSVEKENAELKRKIAALKAEIAELKK